MLGLFRKNFDFSGEAGASASPAKTSAASSGNEIVASAERRPKIGLALGAGAARGWAHIGVLRELIKSGVTPDIVVGTSIGAVVGGCYAAGKIDEIEVFARSMTKRRVFAMMDLSFSGMSLISGERLKKALEDELAGLSIENLPIPFAAVATEIGTGHEVWLQRGDLALAVRASYALPGIFEPVQVGGRWLFDGALVNPIPVTVCRALGADFVIAVNVTVDTMYRALVIRDQSPGANAAATAPFGGRADSLEQRLVPRSAEKKGSDAPNVATAMIDAFNITQDRILRSRLAGDPPDAQINARLDDAGMFDFHKADALIEAGRVAAHRALPNIFAHIPVPSAPV